MNSQLVVCSTIGGRICAIGFTRSLRYWTLEPSKIHGRLAVYCTANGICGMAKDSYNVNNSMEVIVGLTRMNGSIDFHCCYPAKLNASCPRSISPTGTPSHQSISRLSSNGDLNLNTGLDVDDDLLDNLGGGVEVDETLVDAHLVHVPGLGTLTVRRLTGGDLEVLGRETDGACSGISIAPTEKR
jgi:hypothetical protein